MQNKLNMSGERLHGKSGMVLFLFWLVVMYVAGLSQVSAVGFRLPNQDPEAIARGNAFAATADNPSAIYYNPAGITQVEGRNLHVGIYAISPSTEYKSSAGVYSTDSRFQYVPQVYFVDTFTNVPISVGLGMYAPYGLGLNYGQNTPFNTVAESGSVVYLSFNPVIAWRPIKSLSIGIGPTINYSQASFKRAIGVFPGDQFGFHGSAESYGFNAGILWQPHPMWSFGINYRSSTRMNYNGTLYTSPSPPFPANAESSAAITYPQYVAGGVSFRPTTNWNLEFDLDWTEWNADQQIRFSDPALGNPTLTLAFRNSFMYEFGVTRQLGRGYFASVGYIYSQNSSPDANFSPLIPDSDLSLGSVGFGHHGHTFDWAIAYHFAYGNRTVNNDVSPAADGKYVTFNNAVNVSVGFKF